LQILQLPEDVVAAFPASIKVVGFHQPEISDQPKEIPDLLRRSQGDVDETQILAFTAPSAALDDIRGN
jgi:hypothetical protein